MYQKTFVSRTDATSCSTPVLAENYLGFFLFARFCLFRQDEAHLVFSTLNSSGLPCMDQTAPFEVLVVDEAAQSVEVSTIIPLR